MSACEPVPLPSDKILKRLFSVIGIKFPKFNAHATLRNNVWEVKITWNHLNCEESAFIEKYTFKFNNTGKFRQFYITLYIL